MCFIQLLPLPFTVVIVVVCPSLADPDNGTVTLANNGTVRSSATVECLPGYILEGSEMLYCSLRRVWNGSVGICREVQPGGRFYRCNTKYNLALHTVYNVHNVYASLLATIFFVF